MVQSTQRQHSPASRKQQAHVTLVQGHLYTTALPTYKQCYLHSLFQPAMHNAVAADRHNRSVLRWCCSSELPPATVPHTHDTNADVRALSTGMPVYILQQGTRGCQAERPRSELMLSATHTQDRHATVFSQALSWVSTQFTPDYTPNSHCSQQQHHMLPLQPLAPTSLEDHQMLAPSGYHKRPACTMQQ